VRGGLSYFFYGLPRAANWQRAVSAQARRGAAGAGGGPAAVPLRAGARGAAAGLPAAAAGAAGRGRLRRGRRRLRPRPGQLRGDRALHAGQHRRGCGGRRRRPGPVSDGPGSVRRRGHARSVGFCRRYVSSSVGWRPWVAADAESWLCLAYRAVGSGLPRVCLEFHNA